MTQTLSALHNVKQGISRSLTIAEQRVKQNERKREVDFAKRMATIVNSASIVFSTLNSAGHEVLSHMCGAFDAVIIDEAAQSVEPEVLIPLVGANPRMTSTVPLCIMVGDPKQLPATVISNVPSVVKALGRSLFERLQDAKHSKVHMLNTQYRMHPYIARFPSSQFYGGRLRNGSSVMSLGYHQPYHFDAKKRFGPLSFIDTSTCPMAVQGSSIGRSQGNSGEAYIVCSLLVSLISLYPDEGLAAGNVAVLTPYKRQVLELRRQIEAAPALQGADIEVNTVDGIQGREKDVVILSTVRSANVSAVSTSSGIGFVKDERRMNVALTRARLSLIVVGNASVLSQGSRHWAAQVEDSRSHGCLTLVQSAKDMFPEAFCRNKQVARAPGLPDADMLPQLLDNDDVVRRQSECSDDAESDSELSLSGSEGYDECGGSDGNAREVLQKHSGPCDVTRIDVSESSPVPLSRSGTALGNALPQSRSLVAALPTVNAQLRGAAIRRSLPEPRPCVAELKRDRVDSPPGTTHVQTNTLVPAFDSPALTRAPPSAGGKRPVDSDHRAADSTAKRRCVGPALPSNRDEGLLLSNRSPPEKMFDPKKIDPCGRTSSSTMLVAPNRSLGPSRRLHAPAVDILRGQRDTERVTAIKKAMAKPSVQSDGAISRSASSSACQSVAVVKPSTRQRPVVAPSLSAELSRRPNPAALIYRARPQHQPASRNGGQMAQRHVQNRIIQIPCDDTNEIVFTTVRKAPVKSAAPSVVEKDQRKQVARPPPFGAGRGFSLAASFQALEQTGDALRRVQGGVKRRNDIPGKKL
jgi:AAA domain